MTAGEMWEFLNPEQSRATNEYYRRWFGRDLVVIARRVDCDDANCVPRGHYEPVYLIHEHCDPDWAELYRWDTRAEWEELLAQGETAWQKFQEG